MKPPAVELNRILLTVIAQFQWATFCYWLATHWVYTTHSRQRHRQIRKWTEWLTDWLTDRWTDWLTDWLSIFLTGWTTDWLNERLTEWLVDWQTKDQQTTNRQTNRQTDRWAGGWMDRGKDNNKCTAGNKWAKNKQTKCKENKTL